MEKQNTFYWGASTSAHQVEGNAHNNWSEWEKLNAERLARDAKNKWQSWQQEKFPEMFAPENYISGKAADHYNRFEEDFDLAKEGGHTAHRFSIDWARIEPAEGQFDQAAIDHYVSVVKALRARNLEPFVTLWHWTHPVWLEDRGGVLAKDFPEKFAHYAHTMCEALGDDVTRYMTLNEPMSVISSQYVTGAWPHTSRGPIAILTAYKNLSQAHKLAYDVMHEISSGKEIGFTEILTAFAPRYENSVIDTYIVRVARYWSNRRFVQMCDGKFDFLGVQYYFHHIIGMQGAVHDETAVTSDLNWAHQARGLHDVIMEYAQYDVPLYVTEDGLADRDDMQREQFLTDHIAQVHHAMEKGADVRGYFHWSLLDNFEWDKGYWPRFGLVAIDFATQERTPRKSFDTYRYLITLYSEKNDTEKQHD